MKRLDYIDIAKGIAIILVVMVHSNLLSQEMVVWIASYFMPLFFIISGILLAYKKEVDYSIKESFRKRCKQLLPVYVLFSGVNLFFTGKQLITSKMDPHIMEELLGQVIQVVTLSGVSVLWFLPTLFLGELIFLLLYRVNKAKFKMHFGTLLLVMTGGTLAVLWGIPSIKNYLYTEEVSVMLVAYYGTLVIARSVLAACFLGLGYGVYQVTEAYKVRYDKLEVYRNVIIAMIGVVCLLYSMTAYAWNGAVDMNYLVVGNPILYLSNALVGSIFVLCLSHAVCGRTFLAYCGTNSLIIMVTHLDCRVLRVAQIVDEKIASVLPGYHHYYQVLITVMVVIGLEWIIIKSYHSLKQRMQKRTKRT